MDSDVVIWKLLACTITIMINCLGVFLPIYYTEWFYLKNGINKFNCFFGGILFSSAISQMLTESESDPDINTLAPSNDYPLAHFLTTAGFFLTMLMQWLIEGIKRQKHQQDAMSKMDSVGDILDNSQEMEMETESGYAQSRKKDQSKSQPNILTLFIVFGFESALMGTAIGIQRKSSIVIILTLSSASTDWIQAVLFSLAIITAFSTTELRNKNKRKILFYSVFYCVVNGFLMVLWIIAFSLAPWTEGLKKYSSVILALLSGCFAYIACIDVISHEIHDSKITGGYPSLRELIFKLSQFFFGMLIVNMIVLLESL